MKLFDGARKCDMIITIAFRDDLTSLSLQLQLSLYAFTMLFKS